VHAPRKFMRFPYGLALTLVVGCSLSFVAGAAANAAEKRGSAPSDDAQAQYHILVGELAAGRQQPETAAEEFIKALDFVADKALAERATTLALSANNAELAFTAARRWLALDNTSLEAREVLIRLDLRQNLNDDAYAQGAAIVQGHPGGKEDGFRHVALLLSLEASKGPEALALMRKLVEQDPKLSGAWLAQSLLALRFNDADTAEKSAREALRLKPDAKDAPLLLMGALVKKGDFDGADQIVESQIKNGGSVNDLRVGYSRLLLEANQREKASSQLEKILKVDPANTEAHFTLGLIALDQGHIDEAEPHFQTLIKGGDHATDAEYYLGRIAQFRGQPAAALAHYEKVTSGMQALDAALRRASMLAKLGQLDNGIALLDQLRRQYPPLATRFYLAEGEILTEANELDHALEIYGMAIKESDDTLDLLYARSLVYERQKKIELAETDLRAVLAQAPNDARALNALGFMLIVHTQRLDDAEKLVTKALALTPEEPAVIDSMGWLRFRQGKTNEALELLKRAYERFPDPEVAAHYGEALWVQGEHERAKTVWNRALQEAPANTVLRDTMTRLNP